MFLVTQSRSKYLGTLQYFSADSISQKYDLICSITNLAHNLSQEIPNNLRLKKLGNIGKFSN